MTGAQHQVTDSERELALGICRLVDASSVSEAEALSALLTISARLVANMQFPPEAAQSILANAIVKCRAIDQGAR